MARRLVVITALICACSEIHERCRYVTEHTRTPPMARELLAIDSLLLNRMLRITAEARELHQPISASFRVRYAEQLLPEYCGEFERARALASAGQIPQAARAYQGLLLASQVGELATAVMRLTEHADELGQPTGELLQVLEVFAAQTQPVMDAAASRDPERIQRAQAEARPIFVAWVAYLEQWSQRMESGAERLKTAKHVWDTVMLCVAAYEAAEGLAAIVAEGGPGGPFPLAGGAAVAGSRVSPELVEALRKLIADGALDASAVAGLGRMTSPPAGGAAVPLPDPSLPTIAQMGGRKPLPNMEKVKKVNGRYPINAEYAGRTYPAAELPVALRGKYPEGVRFTEDGFPDFRPYMLKEVQVDKLEGNLYRDFARADEAAGITKEFRDLNKLTWHHHQDGRTMQLLSKALHDAVRHTGGVAILGGGDVD
jgi:HNH/ENDO VII superfamily nuclease